jgi:hypothetical protein
MCKFTKCNFKRGRGTHNTTRPTAVWTHLLQITAAHFMVFLFPVLVQQLLAKYRTPQYEYSAPGNFDINVNFLFSSF